MSKFIDSAQFRAAPQAGQNVHKGYSFKTKALDVAARTVSFVASTEAVDRMGDSIKLAGWRLDRFKANPVSHGVRYDVNAKGREKMTGLTAMLGATGLTLPADFSWTDADNEQRPHTAETFLALTTEITNWTSLVHNTAVDAKKPSTPTR